MRYSGPVIGVVVLDNLLTGHRAAVPHGARFVELDLADTAGVESLFRRGAIRRHHALCGAVAGARSPCANRSSISAITSRTQCSAGCRRPTRCRQGSFSPRPRISSVDPTACPLTRGEPLLPGSPYGESKLIIERMLHWCERIHGLSFATLRYFNAAGADPGGASARITRPRRTSSRSFRGRVGRVPREHVR